MDNYKTCLSKFKLMREKRLGESDRILILEYIPTHVETFQFTSTSVLEPQVLCHHLRARSDRIWTRGLNGGGYSDKDWLRTRGLSVAATCQWQGGHALEHTLLYQLCYLKPGIIYKMNIMLYWRRLESSDYPWAHYETVYYDNKSSEVFPN